MEDQKAKDAEAKKPAPSALEGRAKTIEGMNEGEHKNLLGYLKYEWSNTVILSLKDVWAMVISVKELVERKHQRRSKYRYSEVGKRFPYVIGTEFERISQSAENEEVNQYKDAMGNWGIFQIKDKLYSTNSKDEAKACFITLVDKGELRWDDPKVSKTLNRLTASYTPRGAELHIPEDESKMPFGTDIEMKMKGSMDALWGEGQGNEWYSKNVNTYNSNKGAYEHKGKQLDSDPKNTGGLGEEAARMLEAYSKGEYVNPQEYEEMVDFAIKYGKMIAEEKMFYLFAGVAAQCGRDGAGGEKPYGTLIHIDRPSALDGSYLNQFPILDYFRQRKKYNPISGKLRPVGTDGKPVAYTAQEFREFWDHWREEGRKQALREGKPEDYYFYRPGDAFKKFLWEEVIPDAGVRVRISKGLRAARQMDHDDTHLFVPPGTVAEIESVTRGAGGGGGELNFTTEGYANVYPGYNQFFTSLNLRSNLHPEEKGDIANALTTSIQGFITYDSIMDERLHKQEGFTRPRLTSHHYEKAAVVDSSCKVRLHQKQLRNFVKAVAAAYGLPSEFSFLIDGQKTGSIKDQQSNEFKEQIRREKVMQDYVTNIGDLIKADPSKMFAILDDFVNRGYQNGDDEFGLRGIRGSRRPKTAEEEKTAELSKAA